MEHNHPNLKIDIIPIAEDVSLITLDGEMDAHNAHTVRSKVDEALTRTCKIIFDLKNTRYIDSTGINLLVSTFKSTKELYGITIILEPSDRVTRLLNISGLDKYFTIVSDLFDALDIIESEEK